MQMQAMGRKTQAPNSHTKGLPEEDLQGPPIMRNSMQTTNHMQMKTYEQLLPKFSNETGLFYRDIFVYPNNSIYRGQMKKRADFTPQQLANEPRPSTQSVGEEEIQEYRHGYGIQYWTDGAHYEGQWHMNKAEGQGTFWHSEGDIYTGEFKNDMANGYGEYTHINGSKYKGDFRDDVQEGHGEEEWIDGAKYVGSYSNGMKHGYGVYKWANGSIYKGHWD